MKKKYKILLLGDINLKYRSRGIVAALTEDPRDGCFHISQVNPGLYRFILTQNKSFLIRALIGVFVQIAMFLESMIKGIFVDVVMVMPAQQKTVFLPVLLLKKIYRKPIIADQFIFASNTYSAANARKPQRRRDWQLKSAMLADRIMLKIPDLITNITHSELRQIARDLRVDLSDKNIRIIPYSVPAKPVSCLQEGDVFHIMWWGQINPLHGLELVVDACKILQEMNLGKAWKFSIYATPNTESTLAELQEQIKLAGLLEKIAIHTDLNFRNGLEDIICDQCDLALGHFSDESTKAKTIITTKLLDAFAFGVPALNRKTPAIEELIDTKNEMFVCLPEAQSMAESIQSIIENPNERERRARLGHAAWKSRFSLDACTAEFGKIIREFCEQK